MEWTHSICDECWHRRDPERVPVRLTEPIVELCCFCGELTVSGIYVRHDPQELDCQHSLRPIG